MAKIQIEYDGKYPNLCSGKLVAVIDGEYWVFPEYCMEPGGSVWLDDDGCEHVEQGPWSVSRWPHGFPKDLKAELTDAVNNNVTWGKCGGCV